jgi:hypothetical protein
MNSLIFTNGSLVNNKVETDLSVPEIAALVADKKIVVIKNLFPEQPLRELRREVAAWATTVEPATADDFRGNYHSMKAKVSNLQKVPHVFHDYNFNDFSILSESMRTKMLAVFDPLRSFYNELTGYNVPFGFIEGAPYLHPQVIQYPVGGGFFGRHNHNLLPQKIGFILSLSRYGQDYKGGGTCFEINGEIIDMESHQDMGDLVLWPNDVDHWVKQAPLDDWFSWDYETGRWIITLAYFNPY